MQNLTGLILLFIFISIKVNSQNLLPNGDFKEQQTCIEFDQKCAPMGWRLTSADPPTYYREFEGEDSTAHTAWTTFVAFSLTEKFYREYLQAPVLCPLIKGEKYLFSITLRPERFAIREFGVKFKDTSTINGVNMLLMETPDFIFADKNYLHKKKNEWLTLTYEYTARGNERYILIGNFKPDEDTDYKPIKAEKFSMKIAYYVKNVSLTSVRNLPLCDYSGLLQRLRNDRYRHSLFSLQFFQDSLAIQATKPKKTRNVLPLAKSDSTIKPPALPTIYFDFDQYALREQSVAELSPVISYLQLHSEVNIAISGHTDDTGLQDYNTSLALKRAETIKEYLISQGIASSRITSNGYGETNPAASNQTVKGRRLNRRAELHFVKIQLTD